MSEPGISAFNPAPCKTRTRQKFDVPDEELAKVLRILAFDKNLEMEGLEIQPLACNVFHVQFTHPSERDPIALLEKFCVKVNRL